MVAILAGPLNTRGFYSGDQGVKLVMAENAIRHPARPLEVDLPRIAGRSAPFIDRFFVAHEDHAHGLQSPLFPILTTPLLAVFGLSGLYVLPALGFVALWPLLLAWNRQRASPVPTWALGVVAVAANPLFFYAFEFWEHTVAVALLAGSAVAGGSDDRRRQLASGLLTGLAVLLRPEAIWWAAMWILTTPAARAAFVTGLAVVGGAFVSANVVEGAPPLGFHAAANVGVMGDAWLATRLHRFEVWLLPLSPWFIAALAAGVAAWLLRRAGHTERARQAGLVAAVLVAAGSVAGAYVQDSLWWAFPLGGLLLNSAAYQERRDAILVWGTASVVLLTSTHDGGAQWGPRILLIMTPALLLCTAAALSAAATPGRARLPRLVIVGLLVSCGLWTSRHAYLELRGWKRYYGTLAQSLERESTAGGYIVTNVWWLDQIGATLAPSRTFLVASTPEQMTALLNRLREANVERFQLAWSEEPGEGNAPVVDQSCFRIASRRRLAERSLTIATAEALTPGGCVASPQRPGP